MLPRHHSCPHPVSREFRLSQPSLNKKLSSLKSASLNPKGLKAKDSELSLGVSITLSEVVNCNWEVTVPKKGMERTTTRHNQTSKRVNKIQAIRKAFLAKNQRLSQLDLPPGLFSLPNWLFQFACPAIRPVRRARDRPTARESSKSFRNRRGGRWERWSKRPEGGEDAGKKMRLVGGR